MTSKLDAKGTYVTVYLPPEFNELLDNAKESSGRSKKIEAEMRLKDHLKAFESLAGVGSRSERDS